MSATEESPVGVVDGDRSDTGQGGDDIPKPLPGTPPIMPGQVSSERPAPRRRNLRAALFVVIVSVIGGMLAGLWATRQGERYSATAVVQLEPADSIDDNRDVVDVVGTLDRGTIIVTAAGLADSGVVTTAAQDRIELTAAQADDYEVESLQVLTSHLIDITVTGPDEAVAIAYADAIAEELQASFSESYPVYQLDTVTPAEVPDSSGRPGVVVIVVAAMVAAAVGALMLWLALFGGSDERTDLPLARR